MPYDTIRDIYNTRCAAEIFLQTDLMHISISLRKGNHVICVASSELIDCLIVITHNTALTAMADRIIQVKSGQILSNQVNEHPVPVQEIEW